MTCSLILMRRELKGDEMLRCGGVSTALDHAARSQCWKGENEYGSFVDEQLI